MQRYFTQQLFRGSAAVLGLMTLLSAPAAMAQRAVIKPLQPGEFFPPGVYRVFNPQGDMVSVDLADSLGKKPVVLVYWIPGNPRAEQIFSDLLAVTRELGPEKLAVFGVAVANSSIGVTPDVIHERITAVGIDVPVLNDDGFPIGKLLQVRSVPHITIIDKAGRLKLSNGASLSQDLEYKVDVGTAIRRVAESGDLHSYGILPAYYPVRELKGRPAPDFTAPLVQSGEEKSWSGMIEDDKVNVLIFWSVDCPHCRKQLPEINAWIRDNPDGTNLVGCATVVDEKDAARTREFCEQSGFVFPNFLDRGAEISQIYGVTTTPTLVIIGPDGVVNSAITSPIADFGSAMTRKQRELLK